MPEDYEVDALTRRHFLKLSGMVGAAIALVGASPVGWRNPAAAAATDLCGQTNDTDELWQKAHGCYLHPQSKIAACPAEDIDPNSSPKWVVLNGGDHTGSPNTQNFLLVLTD